MINDENVRRRLGSIQLEPDLLLDGCVQRRRGVRTISRGRDLGSKTSEMRVIGRPIEVKIEPPLESCLIDNLPVENKRLHHCE